LGDKPNVLKAGVSKSIGSFAPGRSLSAERTNRIAAFWLKRSTAAIGALSGSTGSNAACAGPLFIAINVLASSKPIRMFMANLLFGSSWLGPSHLLARPAGHLAFGSWY
jgi:hypothetical protein